MSDKANSIEQKLLASYKGRPIGDSMMKMMNTADSFDVKSTSEAMGYFLGQLLMSESPVFQAEMLAMMKAYVADDPNQDAEVIAKIRISCPTIRRFLDDDTVARQFAHFVGLNTLIVFEALTAIAEQGNPANN